MSHTFNIGIAPVPILDSAVFSNTRRTSITSDQPPKRSTSDSALFQAPQRHITFLLLCIVCSLTRLNPLETAEAIVLMTPVLYVCYKASRNV